MSSLAEHEKDIAQAYFGEGKSYQEIANEYGKSREAVRQFLNRHFPDRVGGRTFRRELRTAERRKEEEVSRAEREVDAPKCVVCFTPVTRKTGGRGTNRTCSPECSELWSKARFLLDPVLKERQRLSMAKSILRYPQNHVESTVQWAKKVVNGDPIETRTYVRQNSQAREAYEEVLRIRARRAKDVNQSSRQ